jgi:hypothetical protein
MKKQSEDAEEYAKLQNVARRRSLHGIERIKSEMYEAKVIGNERGKSRYNTTKKACMSNINMQKSSYKSLNCEAKRKRQQQRPWVEDKQLACTS